MTLDFASLLFQKYFYVLVPLFGDAVRGNATLTTLLRDPGLSLDTFYTNTCNFLLLPLFLPLLGVLSGVKAILRLLPLVIPYSGTLMYDMTLVLALLFFT